MNVVHVRQPISVPVPAVLDGRLRGLAPRIGAMGRYRFPAFNTAYAPRYLVVWDLHWQVLDCRRVEPPVDMSVAMSSAIERAAADGWTAETASPYGFAFLRRGAERRLLMLTPRDPLCTVAQSFNPFRVR